MTAEAPRGRAASRPRRALALVLALALAAGPAARPARSAPSAGSGTPAPASPFAADQARLQERQAEIQALLDELARDDLELARLQGQLEAAARELAAARSRLAAARGEAARLEAERRATAARTGAWLRWLQEAGTPGLLDVLLGTASLGDLVWRLDLLDRLTAYELGLLHQASRLAARAESARLRAEDEAARVAAAEASLEERRRSLEALRQERARALAAARLRLAGDAARLQAEEARWLAAQKELLAFWSALGSRSWTGVQPSSTRISLAPPRLLLGFDAAALGPLVGGEAQVGFAPPDLLLDFGPLRLRLAVRALPGGGGAPDRLELRPDGLAFDGRALETAVLEAWSPGPARLRLPDVAPGVGLADARVEPDELLLIYAPRSGG